MIFEVGHFYKGINPDGTRIIYEVLSLKKNSADIKVVIDNDKRIARRIGKCICCTIYTNVTLVTKENKWVTKAKDITDASELIAVLL